MLTILHQSFDCHFCVHGRQWTREFLSIKCIVCFIVATLWLYLARFSLASVRSMILINKRAICGDIARNLYRLSAIWNPFLSLSLCPCTFWCLLAINSTTTHEKRVNDAKLGEQVICRRSCDRNNWEKIIQKYVQWLQRTVVRWLCEMRFYFLSLHHVNAFSSSSVPSHFFSHLGAFLDFYESQIAGNVPTGKISETSTRAIFINAIIMSMLAWRDDIEHEFAEEKLKQSGKYAFGFGFRWWEYVRKRKSGSLLCTCSACEL